MWYLSITYNNKLKNRAFMRWSDAASCSSVGSIDKERVNKFATNELISMM